MRYERSKPYQTGQKDAYKISRSKIELYMQCPRCFWLEARYKIKRPSSPPFQINKAIDELFKKEFDEHRAAGTQHPIMKNGKINAVPFKHEKIDTWRHNFSGIVHLHEPTNLHLFGAVDDIWIDNKGMLIVVDYKATAKSSPVTSLGAEGTWQDMYRRQMEFYQWLLRRNGFEVNDTGYFVYATAISDSKRFNNVLEFETNLIPYKGSDAWVEDTILEMKKVMDSDDMPKVGKAAMGGECEHCAYAKSRTELTLNALKTLKK
jgi:CRISPR/Cas system-associated exonuclease Cas4 (RecB family)